MLRTCYGATNVSEEMKQTCSSGLRGAILFRKSGKEIAIQETLKSFKDFHLIPFLVMCS